VERDPFADPTDGGTTVSCPAATDTPPTAFLPTVVDNCGNTLSPSTPAVSAPVVCEGTRTYTYVYTDCEGNTQDWVFTYTVERNAFIDPADAGSTVSCPAATNTAPTAFLPVVVDNCGNTLSPTGPVVSDPVVCEGTRTYTYTYTDCEGNTQDWVYTYTVERDPFNNPADAGTTVACPSETNTAPTAFLPTVVDNCGNTLSPTGPVVSDPVVCEGTRTYTYTYTDCEGNTQDWVYTYTVERLPFTDPTDNGTTITDPADANNEPTSYLPTVVDNCGNTLSPSAPVASPPIICDGTRTYTYTYTDCEGNTQDWVFTYTVNHTTVVTNTNDSGAGSLRDVIGCALTGETITFAPALMNQTIILTSGEIAINKNLTISGLGKTNLTITGNNASRIFHLLPGNTVEIKNLSLKNATAVTNGGALYNESNLVLENLLFQNNFENGVQKSLSMSTTSSLTIIGNVDLNY
jgi:hypothetical protein